MQLDDSKISESYKIQIIITLVMENNSEFLFFVCLIGWFVWLVIFETGLPVAWAVLELSVKAGFYFRLSFYLSFLSTGIRVMLHHTWQVMIFLLSIN